MPLVVEPGFLQVGDQVPVDLELHGVVQGLLDGRALAARRTAGRAGRAAPCLPPRRRHPRSAGSSNRPSAASGELAVHLDRCSRLRVYARRAAGRSRARPRTRRRRKPGRSSVSFFLSQLRRTGASSPTRPASAGARSKFAGRNAASLGRTASGRNSGLVSVGMGGLELS